MEQELLEWKLALQSLTPGGSEFVDDSKRCVEFVQDVQRMHHKRIIELTRALREANKRISEYEQLQNDKINY